MMADILDEYESMRRHEHSSPGNQAAKHAFISFQRFAMVSASLRFEPRIHAVFLAGAAYRWA